MVEDEGQHQHPPQGMLAAHMVSVTEQTDSPFVEPPPNLGIGVGGGERLSIRLRRSSEVGSPIRHSAEGLALQRWWSDESAVRTVGRAVDLFVSVLSVRCWSPSGAPTSTTMHPVGSHIEIGT